jgi:hypothetical protein
MGVCLCMRESKGLVSLVQVNVLTSNPLVMTKNKHIRYIVILFFAYRILPSARYSILDEICQWQNVMQIRKQMRKTL